MKAKPLWPKIRKRLREKAVADIKIGERMGQLLSDMAEQMIINGDAEVILKYKS